MKKYLLAVLVLVSVFALIGCGGGKDSTGVFIFTDAEITDGKNLPEKAQQDGVTLQYPSDWTKPEDSTGPAFMVTKDAKKENALPASLTLMKTPSNPAFAKMSVEDYQKTYEDTLKDQQIEGLQIVKIEKGKWQGADALYMEYKAQMAEMNFHYVMYYYDNSKDAYIVLIAASEDEWPDVEPDLRKILASITFPKK